MRVPLTILLAAHAVAPAQDLASVRRAAAAVLPSPRQVAWQRHEFTCFVHFGINTFTGREWGTGKEDPALFQPSDLDCDQWVEAARAAGMRLVMITAKHHDGFCLWPSAHTEHDVASSPWRKGRGDVVGELAAACRGRGMGFGIYLCPADLAEIERPGGRYGNGSPAVRSQIPSPIAGHPQPSRSFTYVVDDYNRYFLNQLHELLTRYGSVAEVWFDGANPRQGTGQEYAYGAWYDLIRRLAPDAVIAIKGPDVRWCGNEAGNSRGSEWSVVAVPVGQPDLGYPEVAWPDLGSAAVLAKGLAAGRELRWLPAEVDTSLRAGWFWRDEEQRVRSVQEVLEIWFGAVGGNAVLLLNVPPDRRGRFADRDVRVLRAVGERLAAVFAEDLARGAAAVATAERTTGRHPAAAAVDGDPSSFWKPDDGTERATLTLELPEQRTCDLIDLREAIGACGQRIEEFAVAALIDDEWRELATGTTVGARRLLRFPKTTSHGWRIEVRRSRVCPTLSTVALYREGR